MRFRDLLTLPFDEVSNRIDRETALKHLPSCPVEVVDQFYIDHGRNDDFQSQYADLDLSALAWRKVRVAGSKLLSASCNPVFRRYIDNVRKRGDLFKKQEWGALHRNSSVLECWKMQGTWQLPPLFILGSLIGSETDIHLVEGHTRLGLLGAVIDIGHISPDRVHEIWFSY